MRASRGDVVEIRAFRGTRRSSTYQAHSLSEEALARVRSAATDRNLRLLASLDRAGPRKLDKAAARQLAREVTTVGTSGDLPDLDDDLTAIAEVAHWCAHASSSAWMTIRHP